MLKGIPHSGREFGLWIVDANALGFNRDDEPPMLMGETPPVVIAEGMG